MEKNEQAARKGLKARSKLVRERGLKICEKKERTARNGLGRLIAGKRLQSSRTRRQNSCKGTREFENTGANRSKRTREFEKRSKPFEKYWRIREQGGNHFKGTENGANRSKETREYVNKWQTARKELDSLRTRSKPLKKD